METDTCPTITVSDLEKEYGDETAVAGISFDVKQGEIFGLLGPNGAGKTTTMNMLSTLARPTSGSAHVDGHDISTEEDAVRNSIGVVFQESALDDWLTGRENMVFHARMYGIDDQRDQRIEDLLELVDLTDDADRQVEEYSGGMKRRLEIARGLLHEPEVLFLDEPTLGLDAETRRKIWDYIENLNDDEDMTIIITTHYMEEADVLCDRTAIMQDGQVQALDTPQTLKDRLGGDIIQATIDGDPEAVIADLRDQDWVTTVEQDDRTLSITTQHADTHVAAVVDLIESHDREIVSLTMRQPSLEDVFLHLTGDRFRSGGDA